MAAAAVLLLTAPPAFASRTASTRADLLASPALQPITATPALAPTYIPQGFALRLDVDPHPATFGLFDDLAPASEHVEPEKLASGVESWALTPNLQRIQIFVTDSRWCREFLGPIDSPNLYQAFGLDPMNMTDPMGTCIAAPWVCRFAFWAHSERAADDIRDFEVKVAKAVAKEAAATAVEEVSPAGIVNGASGLFLGYDFIRDESVEGFLARGLAGLSAVPGIPGLVKSIDNVPGLDRLARFDLPGGPPGSIQEWVSKTKHWLSRRSKAADLFEIEQTGPFNFRIHGGGDKADIDGFLDTTILDAKFVDKPGKSPFIPGSGIREDIRQMILEDLHDEFRRLGLVIADPNVPFRQLEIRVNDARAVPFFEEMMERYKIPGAVRVVETAVPQSGAKGVK